MYRVAPVVADNVMISIPFSHVVRNTIGARSCPRKAWLDHPETGFIATGTLSGVSVAIRKLALLAVHEL